MYEKWLKWMCYLLLKANLLEVNKTRKCDHDRLSSLKKDTVEWRRENVFQYFAMDHNTIAFVCVMLLIICIGCTITAFFRKQSTLAWKLCKFRSHVQRIWKRNKELSKELVRTKSQLSLAEQQLIEKGTGVSGILELSRLRFELEAVRNERNALLRRLQSGGGKSQGESRENDNFDFPRMDQFSDQKDILKLITSWKENAQRLIKNLTECEGAADVMKEEMQNYVQGRQNHDSLLREKNSMRRRLEILAREKHEATKKLLSVQKDLKATQKQLEEAKGKLYRSENEIETLKKEADHVLNDKHVLQRQLDISQSEVRMLHTRLENVIKENETCRRHLRALERETWRRSESSPFRLSVTTQESQNHKGTIHDLTKLIEDETSEDQKQLMNSLDGHISDFNRQRKSESSNVIPTHDTDIDDVSVSKDDYDSEVTKIPEKNFVGSPCETSLNTSNVSEKLDNEPTKAGNNFVTNLSSPSGNINCKISINKSSLEPNIFLRTLKAIERYEKSMDLNLMKRKSMQCPSDVRNKSLIDKKKTDDILRSKMKNQSLMEDLYLTREIENWPRGDLISTEGQNRTIPDVQSNITHAVFNQSNDPIAEIPPGRTRENSFHRYPDRATEKESLCSLGSMCSVCSMDGCVVNQDEFSSATQSLQPCPNCLLFIQRFDDREQGRFNGYLQEQSDASCSSCENDNVGHDPNNFGISSGSTTDVTTITQELQYTSDTEQNEIKEDVDGLYEMRYSEGETCEERMESEAVELEEYIYDEEVDEELSHVTEEDEVTDSKLRTTGERDVTGSDSSVTNAISERSSHVLIRAHRHREEVSHTRASFTKTNSRRPISNSIAFQRFLESYVSYPSKYMKRSL
ncbi:putative leucine-rich repeat-containing protein DDB_G0290503 [Periplaneta americana]|uniref:putative leucine-rich repeat-containing protein DDB_G0290503 n=1 Tax=Periplaneta americana TaxID=6978 RepID=UPI0037E78CFA